ncbi:MAG: hypothetical protein D6798_04905 [Deltaproteobacteria bacterium]|nr:MAG: hypothetical protein D6798_04905 [Deltaproteobacteria bacterium]
MDATLTIVSTNECFVWSDKWVPTAGVASVDFLADVRNWTLGTGAAAAVKPAVQLAAVRTDRPDAGAAITAGTNITGNGLRHFQETLNVSSRFWFRWGLSYKLTAGSFASCQVRLHTAFKQCSRVFSPVQVVVNPLNGTTDISFHPVTPVFAAHAVDKVKAAVVIMDNVNTALDWRLFGRGFNDPMAPGSWMALGQAWNQPAAGDSDLDTGLLDLATTLSLSSYQWAQLSLAVRKGSAGDANSRAIFHLIPAVTLA